MTVIPLNPGPYAFAVDTAASISQINAIYLKAGTRAMILDSGLEQIYNGSAWIEAAVADAGDVAYDDANSYTAKTTVETVLDELYTYKPLYSTLTANSAARNGTTELLDSGLTVTLPIAGTYHLEALVSVTTAAAADVSLKWGGTATVTATVGTSDIYYVGGPQAGSDGTVSERGTLLPTSWTTEVESLFATTGALADVPFLFKGTLVATAVGTIKLQFTQGTSNASDTKIQSGSYLKLQRVA